MVVSKAAARPILSGAGEGGGVVEDVGGVRRGSGGGMESLSIEMEGCSEWEAMWVFAVPLQCCCYASVPISSLNVEDVCVCCEMAMEYTLFSCVSERGLQ